MDATKTLKNEVLDGPDVVVEDAAEVGAGVVTALGELAPGAILTEAALARIFGRHAVTVKRAVAKGELPPPVRLFGGPVWTAGAVLDHLRKRLDAAQKEVERDRARVSRLGAGP